MSHNNVVYKILCSDNEVTYVDQTNCKRQFKPALKNIKKTDIWKKFSVPLVVTARLTLHYYFDWWIIKIIKKRPSYTKRVLSLRCFVWKDNLMDLINRVIPNSCHLTILRSKVRFPSVNLFPFSFSPNFSFYCFICASCFLWAQSKPTSSLITCVTLL